jgi:RTX calcium-binding nonapeptide repeat (4 copies)
VVNDLSGTNLTEVNTDLAALGGSGDAQPDNVVVQGTNGDDIAVVAGNATGVSVSSLAPKTNIVGAEGANDRLTVNLLAGDDVVDASALAAGATQLTANGGAGAAVLIGGDGDDVLRGGPGDDVLIGGPGTDVIDGGDGDDIEIPLVDDDKVSSAKSADREWLASYVRFVKAETVLNVGGKTRTLPHADLSGACSGRRQALNRRVPSHLPAPEPRVRFWRWGSRRRRRRRADVRSLRGEKLSQLRGESLDEVGSSMKLGRSRLEERNRPAVDLTLRDHDLDGVALGHYLRAARRHHPGHRVKQGGIRTQGIDRADLGHICGRVVVGEDTPKLGPDLAGPGHLAAVEADNEGVGPQERGHRVRVARVPSLNEATVEIRHGPLVYRIVGHSTSLPVGVRSLVRRCSPSS